MNINEGFLAQMREATQLLQTEGPMAATAAIQRALHGASAGAAQTQHTDWTAFLPKAPELHDINPPQTPHTPHTPQAEAQPGAGSFARFREAVRGKWDDITARQPVEDVEVHEVPRTAPEVADKGRFIAGSCTNHAGTRAYKLYIPSGYKDEALPLVVMLHGCTQDPDDFAAGTGMNAVAEDNNCFVLYPGQHQSANGSKCWNWFNAGDQKRDQGEPSIIADITREIMREYKVDANRIYVAGLSAGGAMAAVMGATYPELYAAVGIHSGLPYAVAHDMPTAFAAMKRGKHKAGSRHHQVLQPKTPVPFAKAVPAIVFHGDRDTTVAPANGELALAQCVPAAASKDARTEVEKGATPNGRAYTRTVVRDAQGKAIAEKWVIHGAGHAWAGGGGKGSYTDPQGPNASREMLRFFLAQRQAA